jgi:two-component system, OmpR family, response regulator
LIPINILIVEGNPNLGALLGWHLQQVGCQVCQTPNIQEGKIAFQQHQPTLTVLDLDLPNCDGMDFCRWLYKQKRTIIFLISVRSSETHIVNGLKAGGDDYLSKPFGIQEFLARVEVLTRRIRSSNPSTYLDYGHLKIDLVQRQVRLKGSMIDLTPQEFTLLYVLAKAEGTPISRSELLEQAWPNEVNNPRTVDTHVLSLRKKVELDPQQPNLIQTVRNVGYRFNFEAIGRSPARNNVVSSGDRVQNFKTDPTRQLVKH